MRLFTETGAISLNHAGEQLCGDRVEVIRENDRTLTMVLADGLGSGVKANILSTLTSKILCTMIAGGMPIEDCVDTIVKTLPVCSVRQVAYSTFTILRITDGTRAELIQFDNPNVILLRGGKSIEYPIEAHEIAGKTVLQSQIALQPHDVLVAMSDGAIFAGNKQTMNYGWQRDDIIAYLERLYDNSFSAKMLAAFVVDECSRLYAGAPADDTTIAAVRIREAQTVNLMMGPPADPRDTDKMMEAFFSQEGARIVCGGTTSQLAAEHLHESVATVQDRTADPADQRHRSCHRGRRYHAPRGGIRQSVCRKHRSCKPVECADRRRRADCAAPFGAGHRGALLHRQGRQSRPSGARPAHWLRRKDPPCPGSGGISGAAGQAGEHSVFLNGIPPAH